jgi:hypothetical protein
MRVYYAGFYNLKPEYLEPIKNIEELHVLRSYYYYKDLMDFLKKVRKYKEEGVVNGSQQGAIIAESSEGACGIGEGGVPQ